MPVTFTAAGREWALPPASLGVAGRLERGRRAGARPGRRRRPDPRLPPARRARLRRGRLAADRVLERALDFEVGRIREDRRPPARRGGVVLRGLRPVVVPPHRRRARPGSGRRRDRRALACFQRGRVALPLRVDPPTRARRRPRARRGAGAHRALRPVRLRSAPPYWLPKRRLATMLAAPAQRRPARRRRPRRDAYFAGSRRWIDRPARDAPSGARPRPRRVVPRGSAASSRRADERDPRRRALAAGRIARVVVTLRPPKRTTARRRRWASRRASAATRRSTAATRTASTTSSSSRS